MPAYLNAFFSFDKLVWAHFGLETLQGYAIMVFAFNAVTNIFIIRVELNNPIEKRMKKVINYLFLI
jgi:amino acid permease